MLGIVRPAVPLDPADGPTVVFDDKYVRRLGPVDARQILGVHTVEVERLVPPFVDVRHREPPLQEGQVAALQRYEKRSDAGQITTPLSTSSSYLATWRSVPLRSGSMTPDAQASRRSITAVSMVISTGNILGVVAMTAGGISLVVLAVVLARAAHGRAAASALIGAALLFSTLGIYAQTTRRGKFAVWAELHDTQRIRGDERVLDVGCGRGAVMTMVAKLLPRGRVVGIDLWSEVPVGQWPRRCGVQLRARGRCAIAASSHWDMRSMPFADASFDLVISSLAVHNILDRGGRSQAIDVIARVLKPSGRVVIADLAWTRAYARQLEDRGFAGRAQDANARLALLVGARVPRDQRRARSTPAGQVTRASIIG